MSSKLMLLAAVLFFSLTATAFADAPSGLSGADTAFILICAAMVLFMTPGLALFYAGMVRRKNVLSTLMHSFLQMGLVSVLWVLVGYTLAFGPDLGGIIGGLSHLGLQGVGLEVSDGSTIPQLLFMIFQGMFAIITVGIISGSWAERIKFSAFFVFSGLWLLLVYAPICHWVWGGGWLGSDGALDFAGGTVVHISSAFSALAGVLVLGKRRSYPQEAILPHNLPITVLGAGMLWFGWFGFNAGSALAANEQAVLAFVTTHIAAASGMLSWLLVDWYRHGKANLLGAVSGAVAGLVVITPACGFVSPTAAILLGLAAGLFCNFAVHYRHKIGFDDSLDVVGVHGVGGIIGAVFVALVAYDQHIVEGGRLMQLWIQIQGVLATIVYAFTITYLLLMIINKTIGLRVNRDEEAEGLDISQHGETGYNL